MSKDNGNISFSTCLQNDKYVAKQNKYHVYSSWGFCFDVTYMCSSAALAMYMFAIVMIVQFHTRSLHFIKNGP